MSTPAAAPEPTNRYDEDTPEEVLEALSVLDKLGYAWAVFSPRELNSANDEGCNAAMITAGWDYIEMNEATTQTEQDSTK
jgi:hypothetical protein